MESVVRLVDMCTVPDSDFGIVDKKNLTASTPVMVKIRNTLVEDQGMTFEDADEAIEEFIQSVKDDKPLEYIETPKGRIVMEVKGL
ncbi:MAG: hypothetical protein IH612_04885 [Desulfofustis sp.]|nr:hypothetical protein [Desulfofustis sp.]